MLTEKEFLKKRLKARYELLEKEGEFIGSRFYSSYHVHLFRYHNFYVEMWKKLGINLIHSIDVVRSHEVLSEYVKDLDLGKL